MLVRAGRIALILLIAVIVNRLARRAINRLADRIRKTAAQVRDRAPSALMRAEETQRADARAKTLCSVLNSTATVMIAVLTLITVLGELQVNLAALIAGAGVVSVAIGFGAQTLVRDVLSGMFILVEDQFGVGDIIDVGDASGTVERITLRSTRLRDVSGTVWHVGNGTILRVGNKSQDFARAVVDLLVSPEADLRQARALITEVATRLSQDEEWTGRIAGTPEELGVHAMGADGVTLRVMVTTEPASQWAVERELRQRLKEAFDAAGIPLAPSDPTIHQPPNPAS